jgi:hypothetical protein
MSFDVRGLQMLHEGDMYGRNATFLYRSSDPSSAISAQGYFGAQGRGTRLGATVQGSSTMTNFCAGMALSDLLMHVENAAGANPGRVGWTSVIATSANQASTASSTGWQNYGLDVTVALPT